MIGQSGLYLAELILGKGYGATVNTMLSCNPSARRSPAGESVYFDKSVLGSCKCNLAEYNELLFYN